MAIHLRFLFFALIFAGVFETSSSSDDSRRVKRQSSNMVPLFPIIVVPPPAPASPVDSVPVQNPLTSGQGQIIIVKGPEVATQEPMGGETVSPEVVPLVAEPVTTDQTTNVDPESITTGVTDAVIEDVTQDTGTVSSMADEQAVVTDTPPSDSSTIPSVESVPAGQLSVAENVTGAETITAEEETENVTSFNIDPSTLPKSSTDASLPSQTDSAVAEENVTSTMSSLQVTEDGVTSSADAVIVKTDEPSSLFANDSQVDSSLDAQTSPSDIAIETSTSIPGDLATQGSTADDMTVSDIVQVSVDNYVVATDYVTYSVLLSTELPVVPESTVRQAAPTTPKPDQSVVVELPVDDPVWLHGQDAVKYFEKLAKAARSTASPKVVDKPPDAISTTPGLLPQQMTKSPDLRWPIIDNIEPVSIIRQDVIYDPRTTTERPTVDLKTSPESIPDPHPTMEVPKTKPGAVDVDIKPDPVKPDPRLSEKVPPEKIPEILSVNITQATSGVDIDPVTTETPPATFNPLQLQSEIIPQDKLTPTLASRTKTESPRTDTSTRIPSTISPPEVTVIVDQVPPEIFATTTIMSDVVADKLPIPIDTVLLQKPTTTHPEESDVILIDGVPHRHVHLLPDVPLEQTTKPIDKPKGIDLPTIDPMKPKETPIALPSGPIKPDVIEQTPDPRAPRRTTTPPPSTSTFRPLTRPTTLSPSLCSNSKYIDGAGYNIFPGDCSKYVQCLYFGYFYRPFLQSCDHGMYWDQETGVCTPSSNVFCPSDQCLSDPYLVHYTNGVNCREYWSCDIGIGVPMCCEPGFSFSMQRGCVQNQTCDDPCSLDEEPQTDCSKKPVRQGSFYEQYVPGIGVMYRACPDGVLFDRKTCDCTKRRRGSHQMSWRSGCKADLYFNFADGLRDRSGNNLSFRRRNVALSSGAVKFFGNGKIDVYKYAQGHMGSKIAIRLKFRPTVGHDLPQSLLSNCQGFQRPSLSISINPKTNSTIFEVDTVGSPRTKVEVPYDPSTWNLVAMKYDGRTLRGTVNGVTYSEPLSGNIESRNAGIIIGACDNRRGFYGEMEEFSNDGEGGGMMLNVLYIYNIEVQGRTCPCYRGRKPRSPG